MNVLSNIFFVLVGLYGIFSLHKAIMPRNIVIMYGVLFAGITLTGAGSAYYHLVPGDGRLVWDRLPMTIVFMSFLSAIIGERISMRAGWLLLVPLLLAGVASVCWWHYTEKAGSGDLRFYALVQFLPMLFVPLILLLFPSRSSSDTSLLTFAVISYIIAKLFEHFDKELLSATGFISGHSLKHVAAAVATWFIVQIAVKKYSSTHSHMHR